MGFSERCQKDKSIQLTAKNFTARLFASIVLFCLILPACSHKQNSVPTDLQNALSSSNGAALEVSSLGIQLTKVGSNHSPFLSKDGKKFVFVSQKRTNHSQGQIYIYDLDALKEKRITYQDGDCRDPILLPNGSDVVYASTTDEMKERPVLLKKNLEPGPFPPTELYISQVSGSDIGRLTQRPGFDGYPLLHPTRPNQLLYTQYKDKSLSIWQLSTNKKQKGLFLKKKDHSVLSLNLSPDGNQWAWIEKRENNNDDESKTQVYVGTLPLRSGNLKPLDLPAGQYTEVIWINDQKVIVTGKSFKSTTQLYSLDLKNQCLQSMVDSSTDLSNPQIHPGRQGIIFTSTKNTVSQIYYKSLPTIEQCISWKDD